jgi:hypothetical protein
MMNFNCLVRLLVNELVKSLIINILTLQLTRQLTKIHHSSFIIHHYNRVAMRNFALLARVFLLTSAADGSIGFLVIT